MQYANMRGVRDFGAGDYPRDPRGAPATSTCASTTWWPAWTRRPRRTRHQGPRRGVPGHRHLARPRRLPAQARRGVLRAVEARAREPRRAPNVVIKISGLGMCDPTWTVESIRPWVMHCIETFGVERASSAPTGRSTGCTRRYPDVLDAYETIIKGFSRERAGRAVHRERGAHLPASNDVPSPTGRPQHPVRGRVPPRHGAVDATPTTG